MKRQTVAKAIAEYADSDKFRTEVRNMVEDLVVIARTSISCGYVQAPHMGTALRGMVRDQHVPDPGTGRAVLPETLYRRRSKLFPVIYEEVAKYLEAGKWLDFGGGDADHYIQAGGVLLSDARGGDCDKFCKWMVDQGRALRLDTLKNPNTGNTVHLYVVHTARSRRAA